MDSQRLVEAQLFIGDIDQYFGSLMMHLSDQIFKVLLVHLEVLHDHVMSHAVPLVIVLPIVIAPGHGLLEVAVHMDTVPMKR